MNWPDLTSTLAALLTTTAFIPQVIKTWRSRSAEDISLLMFLIFTLGLLCWLIYGIELNSMPVIIANGIALLLASSILVMKMRYMLRQRHRIMEAGQRGL